MPIACHYLGLDQPPLLAAADYLLRRYAQGTKFDLRGTLIVLPGRRAGLRLLELLVQLAEARGLDILPGEILTVGDLPEHLYTPRLPLADDLVQQLTWVKALKESGRAALAKVIPHPPAADATGEWLDLGRLLMQQHTELASDGLDFAAVVKRAGEMPGFDEHDRWQAMHQVQTQYLRIMDGLNLWDRQTARLKAIEFGECQTARDIVLVGTADMNIAMRQMLDQVVEQEAAGVHESKRVTALIFASAAWADRFDSHGCLLPGKWCGQPIPLKEEQILLADDPAGQVNVALEALVEQNNRFSADQITLGLADEALLPFFERRLSELNVPHRWGPGKPIVQSGPYLLLQLVARYLRMRRYEDFSALVRHPDLYHWLQKSVHSADWLNCIDKYAINHLPSHVPGRAGTSWLGDVKEFGAASAAHGALEKLLGKFPRKEGSLTEAAVGMRQVLLQVYDERTFEKYAANDRHALQALRLLADALETLEGVPVSIAPAVAADEAIQWVLSQIAGGATPALANDNAVELLGWLELPLDDAPLLIVTTVNEGVVPEAVNSHLFLPNSIRGKLGLLDNDRRFARDAYALCVMNSPWRTVRLIAGRRTADGDPLIPSRLLFAADAETVAKRALRLFDSPPEKAGEDRFAAPQRRPAQHQIFVPRPLPLAQPIASISVTGFAAYLQCPYRFYLSRILHLENVADSRPELDGAAFGSLAHTVLQRFAGDMETRDSTDAALIAGRLDVLLDQTAAEEFGRDALASVSVQVEQLRQRLHTFAERQAEWAMQGWRFFGDHSAELAATANFEVDGRVIQLRGRIDRIDVNEATGEIAVLDYKTSDTASDPGKAHFRGDAWVDLQLPLYRHLARGSLGITRPAKFGYITLPRDPGEVRFRLAEWSESEFESADEEARRVIRQILAGEFYPPAELPSNSFDDFAAICQTGVFEKRLQLETPA